MTLRPFITRAFLCILAACAPATVPPTQEPAAAAAGQPQVVRVLVQGARFSPDELSLRSGDILRFPASPGHDVYFPPEWNRSVPASSLPPRIWLSVEGQSYDAKIDLPPGRYIFVCSAHSENGMVGAVTVVP